jgi:hypothetical protein
MSSLTKEQDSALRTVWDESVQLHRLIDAPQFEDRHRQWKDELSALCAARLIAREGDNYRVTALGLSHLDDPRACEIMALGDAVGAQLRRHFADPATRRQPLAVSDLAMQLAVTREDLDFALQHLLDALIAWCDSYSILGPAAYVRPAERIMQRSSVAEVAAQLETWAREHAVPVRVQVPDAPRTSGADCVPSERTSPGEGGATVGASHGGSLPHESTVAGEPPEVIQALMWIFRRETWKRHPIWASLTVLCVAALVFELLPKEFLSSHRSESIGAPTDSAAPSLHAVSSDGGAAEKAKVALQFYEPQLLADVRAREKHTSGAISPDILRTRFNIAANSLAPYRVVRNARTLELSPERGELLATLIAEGFPFDGSDTNPIQAPEADLTALPQYPKNADRKVTLGPINLSGSYNPTSGFIGYDLTRSDLSNAILPGAKALARSTLRRIPEELPNFESVDIEPVGANLEGAEVPGPEWLRAVEAQVGIEAFGATPWKVVAESGRWIVRAHPDVEFRHAESALASKAYLANTTCAWPGDRTDAESSLADCRDSTQEFCAQYTQLFEHASLTAQERGSLFVLAVYVVRFVGVRLDMPPQAHVPEGRALREQMDAMAQCVYAASLDGRTDLDVSQLLLERFDFRHRDLTRVRWDHARVEGYFHGARLPSAAHFAAAQYVIAGNSDWAEVRVPTGDWEYRVCMARAAPLQTSSLFAEPFFPHSRLTVKPDGDGYVLQAAREDCGGKSEVPLNSTDAERQRFCNACAAPAPPATVNSGPPDTTPAARR